MKFSLNLGQYYSNVDLKNLGHKEIVRRIGAQLGAVEDVIETGERYDGIVVVKVVSCERHPDADKLNLCLVDDGGVVKGVERNDAGLVQVVCGAPNAQADIYAAWIPPGSAVPQSYETESEPFILSAKEIRGQVSNGMLASPRELVLSDDHQGILEITAADIQREPVPGEPFTDLYGMDDLIVDCENKMFTHRPDCFGNIGIARELAGMFELPYESPKWYSDTPDFDEYKSDLRYELEVSIPDETGIQRFICGVLDGVAIGPSPLWMQSFLKRVGIKPVNNVVDITNYVMHFLGQPMHAFDYDKVLSTAGANDAQILPFGPRMASTDEQITLLGDKKVTLHASDVVITAGDTAVALGGVMGGMDTEVDENTQRILLECATFDMYAIRRTSMRHGLFTDAVTRYSKGQSPLQNDRAVWYAIKLLKDYAGANLASEIYDASTIDLDADNLTRVETTTDFINARLGTDLSGAEVKRLLENVEFVVGIDDAAHAKQKGKNAKLIVTAPFWRMDIAIQEDIVEEVGRLYGYDKLPVELPARPSKPPKKNAVRAFKQALRDEMTQLGANEVLTYSFVHGDTMRNVGVDPDEWAYHLRNALSPDLQYYRSALIPSLLTKVHGNIKAGAGDDENEFVLYEFGKAHIKGAMSESEPDVPDQMSRMSCVVAADDKSAKKYDGSAYYMAKKYLDAITNGQAEYEPLEKFDYPITSAYKKGRSARVKMGDQVLGVIGEFHAQAKKRFKLPDFCAGFEVDIDLLHTHVEPSSYAVLSTFPSTTQSITLELSSDVQWKRVYDFVHAEIAVAAAEDHYLYDVTPADMFRPKDSQAIRYTFDVELSHRHKTLKTEEVNTILDHVAAAAEKTFSAKRM